MDSAAPVEPADDPLPGPQIGTGPSAALLALAWLLIQMASAHDGLLLAAGLGLAGGVLVAIGAAFLAGLFESVVGPQRCASTAFAAACAPAAIYWWRSLPWWAATTLSAVAAVGWLSLWRREAALEGLVEPTEALPEAMRLQLQASRHLEGAHGEARDNLVSLYGRVDRAARQMADDRLIDVRRLRRDVEATVIVTLRRLRRLADIAHPDALDATARAEQARVDASCRQLEETYDRLLSYLHVRDDDQTPDLSDHAAQLEHAATGLRELDEI